MEQHIDRPNVTIPKTPDFIKSLFDEDSGLGMDFNGLEDSPTLGLFTSEDSCRKRKEPETPDTPVTYSKRRFIRTQQRRPMKKSLSFDVQIIGDDKNQINDYTSFNEATKTEDIMVEGSVLTGDGSKECCLPTVQGHFHDLRYITAATMTDLLNGKYDDMVNSYRIIDSRYSYEFDGGHIKGAENIHNKDDILKFFDNPKSCSGGKRDILIFHCEFSSERGPKMCRHLRNHDRQINAENYPALYYPEIYILKGGYKGFYAYSKQLCIPMNYIPMLSKDHKDDLRHFRSKSKSWYAGQKKRNAASGRLFC